MDGLIWLHSEQAGLCSFNETLSHSINQMSQLNAPYKQNRKLAVISAQFWSGALTYNTTIGADYKKGGGQLEVFDQRTVIHPIEL